MRTKNNPYKLYTGNRQQIGSVSPKKSPKKPSMQNSTKADKAMRDNGSPQKTPTSVSRQLYPCCLCKITFAGRELLLNHQKEVHQNGPLYACYQCDGIFVGSDPLIRHQKQAHKEGPLFILPQKVVDVMGTKDVEQIVEAYGERLTILDAGGCHGRVMLSIDVDDVDEYKPDVNMAMDHDSYTKVAEASNGDFHRKPKNKNMMYMGTAMANATALERAVEVLKKDVKRSCKQKARTMKMASNGQHNGKDGRLVFGQSEVKESDSINRTKVKQKTVAGKPLKKQHILKVKLRTKAAASKKKKSQTTKKYVCWGCGVSYDAQIEFAGHQAVCKKSLGQFEVLQGRNAKTILEKTIIGTITETEEPQAPLSALIRRRKLPGLSCVFCGEWYMYRFQLDRHKKVCKQLNSERHQFRCSGCKESFSLRYDQCMHILNHCPSVLDDVSASNTFVLSKLRSIQEQTEKERMESSTSATSDGANVPTASTLFCYDCASHIDVKLFREHKLECGAKPPVAMTCLDCCERFPTRLEMNEHKRQNHTYRTRLPLCTCGIVFKKNSDFLQHRKDNPSHCLATSFGPTQTARTPGPSSSARQDVPDTAERMDTSVDKVDASSPQASFVTSVPSEKGKLCRVQVHTSAEGNAITNVTVQFQGQSLDLGVPGVGTCAPATAAHTPAPVPTSRSVAEIRQSVEARQRRHTKKDKPEPPVTKCGIASPADTNPLTALGLVRRTSLPSIPSQANTPTSGTKTVQTGEAAALRAQSLPDDKPTTTTPRQSRRKRINHGPVIKKVMLPGMKIGYLVPVSKTTNQQAAVAEAKELLQKIKPRTNNAATSKVSEEHKPTSSGDTSATTASNSIKAASPVPTSATPKANPEMSPVQKQTPQTHASRTPAVQPQGTFESAQESHALKPEPPKPTASPQSSTVTSPPRKKLPQTSADISESSAEMGEPAAVRTSVEPASVQTKPASQKPGLRKPSNATTEKAKQSSSRKKTPQTSADKSESSAEKLEQAAARTSAGQTKVAPQKLALRKLPSATTDKVRPIEKQKQAPKRKRNENAELDDSSNEPNAKRLRPTGPVSRGSDRRRDGGAQDKSAKAVVTPGDRGPDVIAKDIAPAKRAAVGRSQQSSPSRHTKSARTSPCHAEDVASSVTSQPAARSKTTSPSKDTVSTTRAGVRHSDSASSPPSTLKPDLAQRPRGLMLIAPVNNDMVRCIRCETTFTRVRDITAHECDGRPVSVIVQAELKIGGPGRYPPCGNLNVNGNGVKEEPETDEGQ